MRSRRVQECGMCNSAQVGDSDAKDRQGSSVQTARVVL